MTSTFWDSERTLLVQFLKDRWHNRFMTMCAHIKAVKTTNSKGSAKHKDESSPHPTYSSDLAPSDFNLFGPLKKPLRGRRVADDKLKHSVRQELRRFIKELRATGIQRLTQKWKNCVDNEGDFVEKEFRLCKGRTNDM
jgi:hypothetical protein